MIRFAQPGEGQVIRDLTIANGTRATVAMVLDWTKATDSWLVEERDGKIVGAIQVCFGIPTARLEDLSVDLKLDGRTRARIMRDLGEAAMALCKQLGASAVRGFVPFKYRSQKRNYKKRGWAVVNQGNMMLRIL